VYSYYRVSKSKYMRPLLRHKSAAVAIHWLFQGILQMDATERAWKAALDAILAGAIFFLFCWLKPMRLAQVYKAALALLAAHTINFLLNAHFWVVLKHFGSVSNDWTTYQAELMRLRQRIAAEPYIRFAAAYGSLARAQWSPHSDLDLRLVRAPGLNSALHVCWFATRERARAFFRRFPLDVYVLDQHASLANMAESACPVILGGSDCSPAYQRE